MLGKIEKKNGNVKNYKILNHISKAKKIKLKR